MCCVNIFNIGHCNLQHFQRVTLNKYLYFRNFYKEGLYMTCSATIVFVSMVHLN